MLILREGLLLLRMFQKSWSEKTQQPVAAWQSSLSGALAGDFVVSQVLLTILGYSRSALIFKDFFEGKKKKEEKNSFEFVCMPSLSCFINSCSLEMVFI